MARMNASSWFGWTSMPYVSRTRKNFFETRVIEYQTGGGLDWD